MVPFDMLGIVSYYCAIVTLSLRGTGFEIFVFNNDVNLKPGLGVRQNQRKSHHSIERI